MIYNKYVLYINNYIFFMGIEVVEVDRYFRYNFRQYSSNLYVKVQPKTQEFDMLEDVKNFKAPAKIAYMQFVDAGSLVSTLGNP